ncbi:hypothetical protein BZA70DRAFT_270816 [Myxozyma melibiosi]|uniref:Transcription factor Iwr1 domain-containing protein n=1 Tax=Myxozyma melibiosi TaxID=54550 RepID=A0ABR1FBL8_9ASCO
MPLLTSNFLLSHVRRKRGRRKPADSPPARSAPPPHPSTSPPASKPPPNPISSTTAPKSTPPSASSRKQSIVRSASTRIKRSFAASAAAAAGGRRRQSSPKTISPSSPFPSALATFDASASGSDLLHKLNPIPRLRHATIRMTESPEAARVREKEAVINAGVIYGTRTYDWGVVPLTPSTPGAAASKTTTAAAEASSSSSFASSSSSTAPTEAETTPSETKRKRTIQRIFEVSKTILRTKPLPSLPVDAIPQTTTATDLQQNSDLARQGTVIEISSQDEDNEVQRSTSVVDCLATFAQEKPMPDDDDVNNSSIENDDTNSIIEESTESILVSNDDDAGALRSLDGLGIRHLDRENSRRRFSFDSSVAGTDSLFRNDSDASRATRISLTAAVEDVVGSDVDVPPSDEDELDIEVPFAANLYSSDELANITAFEFTDDLDQAGDDYFDDLMLDEVNNMADDDDDGYSDDGSDFGAASRPARRPSLTPISERTDEDSTPTSSPFVSDAYYQHSPSPAPFQSSPLAPPRTHDVVAYVRKSRGWVVERRRRKGGWGSHGADDGATSSDVEEELVGTERVEKRAI